MPRPRLSRRAPPKADAAPTALTGLEPRRREATTSSDLYGHSDQEHERLRAEQHKKTSAVEGPQPPPRRSTRHQVLVNHEGRRDDALDQLAAEAARTSSSTFAEMEKSDSSVELGRREGTTPQQRRDTTGLEIEDTELFGGLDSSFAVGSAPKGGRSTDTSSLSINQFKRRSRAPSFSGTEGLIRPSSRGPNTPGISSHFSIGRFRRRVREPSILGRPREDNSSQNPSRQASEQPESEDGDAFAPEAESTPLDQRKSRRVAPSPAAEGPQLSSSVGSRSRKRKTVDSTEVSDRPEKASRLNSDEDETQDDDLDSESDSSLPSPRSVRPSRQERPVTPVNLDEIMAPPVSSGSEDDDGVMVPDIRNLAKRRRHVPHISPLHDDNRSDISSPPSLTHSPNFHASKPAAKARGRARKLESTSKITTADLTALLPRRLHKKGEKDAYEIDSSDGDIDTSGLGQDEDELSYLKGRARRPLSRAASRNRPASRETRSAPASARARQTAASRKSMNRTYGRNSDKENQDDEDEDNSFAPLGDNAFDDQNTIEIQAKIGEELTKAVKKFKEVDRWELSFEEVADSPSPSDAR